MYLKNKTFIFFIALLFLFIRCGNENEDTIPNSIISKEKFAKLITDFLLAESATNLNIKQVDITKFDSTYTFNPLKENNVTKSQYDSAVNFYSKHPQLYKQIYDDALQLLSEMQTLQKAKIASDSLKTDKNKKDSQIFVKHIDSITTILRKKIKNAK
ncbi:MAG: DUF4296 domain-containing protein [Bacteroidota bacterium]|nr:DUF4296 domain-containing protein [Bacteroidota bacterium]